jgi:hypothetical protein
VKREAYESLHSQLEEAKEIIRGLIAPRSTMTTEMKDEVWEKARKVVGDD